MDAAAVTLWLYNFWLYQWISECFSCFLHVMDSTLLCSETPASRSPRFLRWDSSTLLFCGTLYVATAWELSAPVPPEYEEESKSANGAPLYEELLDGRGAGELPRAA